MAVLSIVNAFYVGLAMSSTLYFYSFNPLVPAKYNNHLDELKRYIAWLQDNTTRTSANNTTGELRNGSSLIPTTTRSSIATTPKSTTTEFRNATVVLPTRATGAALTSPLLLTPTSGPTEPPKDLSVGKDVYVRKNMMKYFRGSERVVNMLLPRINNDVLSVVSKTKTFKSRSKPSKKFYGAIKDIEEAVVQASVAGGPSVRYSEKKITSIKSTIELAVDKRMYRFARQRLGQALFLIGNHNARRRTKRSTDPDPSTFIEDLKRSLGEKKFEQFMAVRGEVTLIFAIDTTGSMSGEIDAAKRIAVEVANYKRDNPVSFILSPFNDPNTEPVTFVEEDATVFVKEINKLRAHGGGDCPELTMKGILEAIYEAPDEFSPMYVFTDASAKDATPKNLQEVKKMAEFLGITINFFTTGLCSESIVDHPFTKIADATSGQVFRLSGTEELNLLKRFTGSGLNESSTLASGAGGSSGSRKRRSTSSSRYSIKIDDSISTFLITVTTDKSGQGPKISLEDSKGVTVTSGKMSMSQVTMYEIERPTVGTWTLVIPSSAGIHTYFARSIGESSIDFQYYFLKLNTRKPLEEPLTDPLKGHRMKIVLTITGAGNIRKGTVALEFLARNGDHIQDIALTSESKEGERYSATFIPPSQPFKLKIKGTTNGGNPFERISRKVEEPKYIQLRILFSLEEFTLRRGEVSTVTFRLYNAANVNKRVKIEVSDRLGYSAAPRRNVRTIRKKRRAFFRVEFTTPSSATIGAKDTAFISVSVNGGEETVTLPVQLLVNA